MIRKELWKLILIHFKELLREPGVLFWGIGFPIIMAFGLGIAFTGERETRKDVAVIGNLQTGPLPGFLQELPYSGSEGKKPAMYVMELADPVFGRNVFRFIPENRDMAITGIKKGRYNLVLESRPDTIFFHLDPDNPEARLLQLQISGLIYKDHGLESISFGSVVPLDMKGTRYIDFLIPGLIALGIMMACLWGVSYTMIERRKGKMLRRMMVTPMHRENLLMGLMTARVTMNFLEAGLLFLFAWWYFDLQLQGSPWALILVFFTGNMAFTGLAILISSRTSNTEIANGLINFVTMPMMILSGIFFSYQNFPEWSIPLIQKLPLTMLADSIRSIFNEGAGILDVLDDSMILGATGLLSFVAGIKIYKWY